MISLIFSLKDTKISQLKKFSRDKKIMMWNGATTFRRITCIRITLRRPTLILSHKTTLKQNNILGIIVEYYYAESLSSICCVAKCNSAECCSFQCHSPIKLVTWEVEKWFIKLKYSYLHFLSGRQHYKTLFELINAFEK